ncbi:unnamed protein product [Protopolystoma xenopodis]|uniref:Uncharacterized protein n=1 Tax=Protopolystoma xenopodis TaxID=117903 RepID=A0A3S5A531_9PLAT|nr:unnamed protein product [Protopolystoma xenopodis]
MHFCSENVGHEGTGSSRSQEAESMARHSSVVAHNSPWEKATGLAALRHVEMSLVDTAPFDKQHSYLP